MRIVAYSYCDPLLESPPQTSSWRVEIERIYLDLGGRQQLEQLFKDCQIDPPDYVLIPQLEELGESIRDVCDRIASLEVLGIQLVVQDPQLEILSPPTSGIAFLKLLADIQGGQQSRRLRKGHAKNRIKALPPPGKAPYGYRRGKDRYVLDRSAVPTMKDFFDRFLLYGSLRGAVRYIAKKYGKKISVSTGRRWLTNPVYRGDIAYQNGQVISNTHVPIISREEAAQIDRLLRRNRRLPPRTASAPRSLAGLVVCGECHSPTTVAKVTTYRNDRDYLYLRPIRCPQQPKCKAFPYEEVLQLTITGICQNLPLAVAELQLPDMERLKAGILGAIAKQQEILNQLPILIANGVLDDETAQLRIYKVQTEIAQLQSQLAQLPPVNLQETAKTVCIPQFWLDLSETERRFYFREFIRQIEIFRDKGNWQIQLMFIF